MKKAIAAVAVILALAVTVRGLLSRVNFSR
jgi:hypothetical protein